MKQSDDIVNLFQQFGGKADPYQELARKQEHQRSSENGMGTDYFTGWNEKTGFDDLLPHEFTHS